MRRHVMTVRRKAALRKAQLASARKRAKKHLKKTHKKSPPLTNAQVYAVRGISIGLGGAIGVLAFQGSRQARMVNSTLKMHKQSMNNMYGFKI